MLSDLSKFDHLPTVLSSVGVALSHLRSSWRWGFNLYAWRHAFADSERKTGHPIFGSIRMLRAALGAYPNRLLWKDTRQGKTSFFGIRDAEKSGKPDFDPQAIVENWIPYLHKKVQTGGNNLFLCITGYAVVVNFLNFRWFREFEAKEGSDEELVDLAVGVAPDEVMSEEDEEKKKAADLKWVTWLQPFPKWFKISYINLISGFLGLYRIYTVYSAMQNNHVHFLGETMRERFINSLIDYSALPVFLISIYKWEQPFILRDLLGLAVTDSGMYLAA